MAEKKKDFFELFFFAQKKVRQKKEAIFSQDAEER